MVDTTENRKSERWWWPRARREETRALTRETVPEAFFPESSAGPVVTPRSALAIADAWACVRVLADSAASLPLHAYRRSTAGGRQRLRDGTADLLRRPAPGVTQAGFVGHLVLTLVLHGNAFIGIYRDGDGVVQQLGVLSPDAVTVRVVGGMPLYDITTSAGVQTVGPGDVIHVRSNLSLDGLLGLSPVAQAREALGLSRALSDHGAATARSGTRLSGVLTVSHAGPDEDDLMKNLDAAFSARHSGPAGAGRFAVLSSEVSFTPITMPLADAQFIEQREFSTREVCRVFGVPPWLVGASSGDSLTYSNTTDQARAFVTFSLRPWLIAIEQALGDHPALFPDPGTYAAFDLDGLLRADPGARADVYTKALDPKTGWMTRAEVRSLEDLPAEQTQEVPANA